MLFSNNIYDEVSCNLHYDPIRIGSWKTRERQKCKVSIVRPGMFISSCNYVLILMAHICNISSFQCQDKLVKRNGKLENWATKKGHFTCRVFVGANWCDSQANQSTGSFLKCAFIFKMWKVLWALFFLFLRNTIVNKNMYLNYK